MTIYTIPTRKTGKKGLEPLTEEIYRQAPDCKPPMVLAAEYINPEKGVETAEEALTGAMDIIAEKISDDADIRKRMRFVCLAHGMLTVKAITEDIGVYEMYAKKMVEYIAEKHKGKYSVLQVGTGDSPLTVPFYEKCGFVKTHSIKNFFIDNYDHPIYECGVRLTDMIYLQRAI